MISVICNPAETILVYDKGPRLRYSQGTVIRTEIPGSGWISEADGFGFAPESLAEPAFLELTGLGEDCYGMVSVERFGRLAGGAVSSRVLVLGEVLTVRIDTGKFIFLPLMKR